MARTDKQGAEARRLEAEVARQENWKRWGTYLPLRQWGTVREDYSASGEAWTYFPHEHARSRAYRWGEDGLLGICDRQCRLCFAPALWNGRDPILKERFFGLSGPEGNHGEDVKEEYFFLDCTPTYSYAKALYKYPQQEFPYAKLVEENRRHGRTAPEFELREAGAFDRSRYFDVFVEYAKASCEDLLVRITIANRSEVSAALDLLGTLWFRNTWSWGAKHEDVAVRPRISAVGERCLQAEHPTLGRYFLAAAPLAGSSPAELLFTENETNRKAVFGLPKDVLYAKDAFHEYLVQHRSRAVNPARVGTKAAVRYHLQVPGRGSIAIRLRLTAARTVPDGPGADFDEVMGQRKNEADEFYRETLPGELNDDQARVVRQAYAGLLWSKQFYHYVVDDWLKGDPLQPAPPRQRLSGRNAEWRHLYNRDILSVPDKWEYPWYAAWDLAFHMIPMARIDPVFAKEQLVLLLREWYMHPNGQLSAYEFALGDVNPPVHAWACWRVYKMTGRRGERDRTFLSRCFQKLLINFTWWVNRKDLDGKNLFSGGFLGLDNIGVFDRSLALPTGGSLQQADATAWMAFYCTTMLSMALELSRDNPATEDMASKFFEHFVAITEAMNTLGGTGLWDESDGFYYDHLRVDSQTMPLRVRSLVGLVPLLAVEVLEDDLIERLPGFRKRMEWFLQDRPYLNNQISYCCLLDKGQGRCQRLLAVPSLERLKRLLRYMLDEQEFLSPYGIRSLSRVHEAKPYVYFANGQEYRVDYSPGESTTALFGGNSNWRGPVWFPLNYLLVEALERYHHFYGDGLQVECPTGSGRLLNLKQVAQEISRRLVNLFTSDKDGRCPWHGAESRYAQDPHWRDLTLFHEYFHAETGRGLGASHQTGWTGLIASLLQFFASANAEEYLKGGSAQVEQYLIRSTGRGRQA